MTRMTRIMRLPAIVLAWVALLAASTPLYAQSRYEVMDSLDGPSSGRLVQASNGNFYGVTYLGGDNGKGTVFRLTPDGILKTIASFTLDMGAPSIGSGLLQASDGNLYGTTDSGANFAGTIFRVTLDALGNGSLSTWATFDASVNGAAPSGRLIEGRDGFLYGTALVGPNFEPGAVFRVDATGTIQQVAVFPPDGSAGEFPSAGLVQAADGSFYGTAESGGANFAGTIFRVADGQVTAVHSFNLTDGANPVSPLLHRNGTLYGTTFMGGATAEVNGVGDGTLFEFSLTTNTLRTLGSFDGANGSGPYHQGVVETAGFLYGTTFSGGDEGVGTVYRWSEATGIQKLHSTGSESPDSTLVLGKDGSIYGTAITLAQGGVLFRILSDVALQVSPARANFGGTAKLMATLTGLEGPKANAKITFSVNGVQLGSAMTGTNGVATLNVSVAGLPVGSHPNAIVASFAGADGVLPTSARGDLTIEFLDATPPTLKVPSNMVVNATSPQGAKVTFAVTATDDSGGAVMIACTPASGSVFKIGATTVNCTATDAAGNVSKDSFKVKVLSAAEQIVDLVEQLRGMPLHSTVKKLLTVVLQSAIANPKKATFVCSVMDQFISYVNKHAGSNPTLANELIANARRIQAVIGCM